VKADKYIAACRQLREQPVWRLLASRHGPFAIGLLQSHLFETESRLPASVFYERISRDLEELRARGDDFPQPAQAYAAEWLREGYLERRFPSGAAEEESEVSSATAIVIRFITGLAEPRIAATESRLAVVIQQLVKLAEETDSNPETRVASLLSERERLDRQIEEIRGGRVAALLRENLFDHLTRQHRGPLVLAIVEEGRLLVIETHHPKYRRVDIVHVRWPLGHAHSDLIGRATYWPPLAPPPPKTFRVGLYARVSTHDQQTLPLQMRAMREYHRGSGSPPQMESHSRSRFGSTSRARPEGLRSYQASASARHPAMRGTSARM